MKDPYWIRFKLLMRGLLFYNTIYWRRASDGLKPPTLSPTERKFYEPPLNPEVIRPRQNPRARIDEGTEKKTTRSFVKAAAVIPEPAAAILPAPRPVQRTQNRVVSKDPPSPVVVKRRRRRRSLGHPSASKRLVANLFSRLMGR